jgi:hypothetical protein
VVDHAHVPVSALKLAPIYMQPAPVLEQLGYYERGGLGFCILDLGVSQGRDQFRHFGGMLFLFLRA